MFTNGHLFSLYQFWSDAYKTKLDLLYFADNHEKFEISHGAFKYDRSENTNT
jgi:hypothetical protein